MIVARSPRFDRAYKKLSRPVQELFKKQVGLLVSSRLSHPSLRTKKVQGTDTIWEARIDVAYRFTFEKIEGGIRLRVIGKHDVLERP